MYTILASYTTHTQHVYSWYWYFTIDDGTVTRDACLNTHTCKLTLWGLHSWTSLHSVHGVTEPGEGTCTQLVFSRYLLTVAIDQWRIQRGSMGSMEPLFGRLRSKILRSNVLRTCQLLYQEFDARMAYTCTFMLPEARDNHQDNEQSERAN